MQWIVILNGKGNLMSDRDRESEREEKTTDDKGEKKTSLTFEKKCWVRNGRQ